MDRTKISTVLALTDNNADSLAGLRSAYMLAERLKAKLVVGHVLVPRTLDPSDVKEFLAANGLDPSAAVIDIEVDADIISGIDLLVDREHPDLVVLSSHRKRGFTRLLTASVPVGLAGNATAPVLALHSDSPPRDRFLKALVCVDGSAQSQELLDSAVCMLEPKGSMVAFLVIEDSPLVVGGINIGTYDSELMKRAGAEATRFLNRLKAKREGIRLECDHRVGNAVEEICAAITRHKADLVVVGTGGIGGKAHFVIGKVAQGVVREADVPALVVPTRRASS